MKVRLKPANSLNARSTICQGRNISGKMKQPSYFYLTYDGSQSLLFFILYPFQLESASDGLSLVSLIEQFVAVVLNL